MSYGNGNKDRYYFRMIYDLTWFLFIQVTFMNIIFGIIIDTFAGKPCVCFFQPPRIERAAQ